MVTRFTRAKLDKAYDKYNHRKFIHPDPLEFLFEYRSKADREVVGLVASGLAYGRVAQILKSVGGALDRVGNPSEYVRGATQSEMKRDFRSFKHRFTTGDQMAALLAGARDAIEEHGSLGACFESGMQEEHTNVLPALDEFVARLSRPSKGGCGNLLPNPSKGSACKRLNLYLRWMVRKDRVDPGGWNSVWTPLLIIPLDTHMHRVSLAHGLTSRKAADMRTAIEITNGFARFCPQDPVKYDFALTRPGIRGDD